MSIRTLKAAYLTAALFVPLLHTVPSTAEGNVPYWFEPRSNQFFGDQVIAQLADKARILVIRAHVNGPAPEYGYSAIVDRIKSATPSTKILAYAQPLRLVDKGRVEANVLRYDLPVAISAIARNDEAGTIRFVDPSNSEGRRLVTDSLVRARTRLHVDGLALDLVTRTPNPQPQALAKQCRLEDGYCERYAAGTDALLAELKQGLAPGYVIYNGLFNGRPGLLQDQLRLLSNADAAIVEYFGLNPNRREHSFSADILPYLKAMEQLPSDKALFVFGRGPWAYTDYAEDYLWQRYLYACFLLAARNQDAFKYHSSFQVPAHKGRSGGFDHYADWDLKLGEPVGAMSITDGLYHRRFSNGLVVVAPDDGPGGSFRLSQAYATPEGNTVRDNILLGPGQAAILLAQRQERPPVQVSFGAKAIAAWKWKNSALDQAHGRPTLRLSPLPDTLVGEHDLLLDHSRSLSPFNTLTIEAQLETDEAAIYAIAEVDDPRRESMWLVIQVGRDESTASTLAERILFRTRPPDAKTFWPQIEKAAPSSPSPITLDGQAIAAQAGLKFRRWSHLRFSGQLNVWGVAMAQSTNRNGV